MITRQKYRETIWVDLNQPTEEEATAIVSEFGLNPFIVHDLVSPSYKSRVELHKDHLYLILHFPVFKHSHSGEHKQEVDFIIGRNFLLTIRYDTIDPIEKFLKLVEVNSILNRDSEPDGAGALFFAIVNEIYVSLFNELEYVETWINKIELNMFNGHEREMVYALSDVSRTLINFKKATSFHREVLKNVQAYGAKIFDEHFVEHTAKALHEYNKFEENLNNTAASVTELRETNNSLVSTRQNEIMKTLTIISFVTFPLMLITAIFSMNTSFIPIVGYKYDFWVVICIMLFVSLCMLLFFKHKKWL